MPKENAGKRLREPLVGKIAVKVVNHYDDEVPKVFRSGNERRAAWQLLLCCSLSPLQGAQIGLVGQLPRGQRLFDTSERSTGGVVSCLLAEHVLQTNRATFAGFHGGQSVRVAVFLEPSDQPEVSLQRLLKSQLAFGRLLSFQAF